MELASPQINQNSPHQFNLFDHLWTVFCLFDYSTPLEKAILKVDFDQYSLIYLVSGGAGVTPMMSIAESLLGRIDRRVEVCLFWIFCPSEHASREILQTGFVLRRDLQYSKFPRIIGFWGLFRGGEWSIALQSFIRKLSTAKSRYENSHLL